MWVGMGGVAEVQGANMFAEALGITADGLFGWILKIIGGAIYVVLSIASFGLSIAAVILNFSMYLTTHLDLFIKNTPAIYQIWGTLRDLASMVLIFSILIASIQMILNLKPPGYGTLLKNIIIAGIAINFSFFFTQVLIDGSNIISLQFYNAMSSTPNVSQCEAGLNVSYLTCAVGAITSSGTGNGGIANVFMGALDITQWWSNKGQLKDGSQIDIGLRLILVNSAAIVVTVIAALSFIGAAAAALWRIVVLIMLLAFSPLWIAGFVLPQLKKEVSDSWWNHLKANLIFLPVYLFLTYVVVQIMVAMNLSSLAQGTGVISNISTGLWYVPYLQLSVGFAIAIFLINLPLVTALKFSGASKTILESFSKGARAWAGRKTVGRTAYALNQSKAVGWLTSRVPGVGSMVSGGLSKVSSTDWGSKNGSYESQLKAQKKRQEGMHERLEDIDKAKGTNYAEKYHKNLPYKNSVLRFMLDGRARSETATNLNREKLADDLEKNEAMLKALNERINQESKNEIATIDKQIKELAKNPVAEAFLTDSEKAKMAELRKTRDNVIEKYKENYKTQIESLNKNIKDGKKAKGKKDWKHLVEELNKEVKPGSNEEKPTPPTGGETPPKTP